MFLMCSGAIYFDFPKHHFGNIFRRFSEKDADELLGRRAIDVSRLPFTELSQDEVRALLIHCHEHDHADCYFSSPLGLLLFRCQMVLSVSLGWLFESFFIPGALVANDLRGKTFTDWLETGAPACMEAAVRAGRIKPALPRYVQESPAAGASATEFWLNYARTIVLPEILVVSDFLDALLFKSDLTLGQFADLGNRAFDQLSERCEIPKQTRWTTTQRDLPLHPRQDSILSTEEIFEYLALVAEREALVSTRATEAALCKWRMKAAFRSEPYSAGFNLERKSGFPEHLLQALSSIANIALRSPIDLCVGTKGEMLVETHHPSWRMRNGYFVIGDTRDCPVSRRTLAERLKYLGHNLDFATFETRISRLTSLPQPIVSALACDIQNVDILGSGLINERYQKSYPDPRLDPVNSLIEVRERFRAGIGCSMLGKLPTYRPLPLLYYSDYCSLNLGQSVDAMFKYFGMHGATLGRFLQLSLLSKNVLNVSMAPLDSAFVARLNAIPGLMTDKIELAYSWKQAANNAFGPAFSDSLSWWD